MKYLAQLGASVLLAVITFIVIAPPAAAANDCFNSNGTTTNYCKLDSQDSLNIPSGSLGTRVSQVVNILGLISGILSVLFLVIGGINFATSEGDPKKLAGAKSTIAYAIGGLVISIIAPLIVGFVIGNGPQ